MATIGYARCSILQQDLTGQLEQLQTVGCNRIFKEKESGARSDRPELAKAVKALKPNDCLIVVRLDRLARSTLDLLRVLDQVGRPVLHSNLWAIHGRIRRHHMEF